MDTCVLRHYSGRHALSLLAPAGCSVLCKPPRLLTWWHHHATLHLHLQPSYLHTLVPQLQACMNECLRLLSPVPITTRECTEDTTVNHIRIPKGSNVVFDLYGIHRDPRYWVNPEAFRPERMLQVGC